MYQLQNDLSINMAGGFAGSRLNRVQVDAAHPFRCLPVLQNVSRVILKASTNLSLFTTTCPSQVAGNANRPGVACRSVRPDTERVASQASRYNLAVHTMRSGSVAH